MLYGEEKNTELEPVINVLRVFGMPENYIEVAARYLDTSEPVNENLLLGLKPCDIGTALGHTNHQHNGVMYTLYSRIFPKNSELHSRFINFAFAAAGLQGSELIFRALNEYGYRETLKTTTQFRVDALARRYGGDAAVIELCLRMYYFGKVCPRPEYYFAESADLCIKALEMFDRYAPNGKYYLTFCGLCIMAFDKMPLPGNGAVPPAADSLCKRVINIYKSGETVSVIMYNTIAVALAEAAYYSPEAKQFFTRIAENNVLGVAKQAASMQIDKRRVLYIIESIPGIMTPDYIRYIADGKLPDRKGRLARLAGAHPNMFRTVLSSTEDVRLAGELQNILAENDPTFNIAEYDLKNVTRRRIVRQLEELLKGSEQQIRDYMDGKSSFDDIYPVVSRRTFSYYGGRRIKFDYYGAFGADDFFKRLFTVFMIADIDAYYLNRLIHEATGFSPIMDDNDKEHKFHEAMSLGFMLDCGAPMTIIISSIGLAADPYVRDCMERAAKAAAKYPNLLEKCDPKKMCVNGRIIYALALAEDTSGFGAQLAALSDDSSKAVRETLLDIYKEHRELSADVTAMLKAKKQSKRELALSIIEAWGAESFGEELRAAFEAEKTEKVRIRIGALIGSEIETAAAAELSEEEQLKKLTKGAAKVAWLYDRPFAPVHRTDGREAPDELPKAIMLCYAGMDKFGRNKLAEDLAAKLNTAELEAFAAEVFGRWSDRGAQAKQKWVLYFCAVHGGSNMCRDLIAYIKSWGENMRGAIAAEAVKALALNGSSEALMAVDNMSRKFKNKQVRAAASMAMTAAAEELGITTEELADKIVPDLGFDENLCRVFDYGKRQFSVYIRPSLELEIFNGEKKVKSMPKPAASDDAEKANAAYEAFKDMKKQMKAAVTSQKQRLEYVLMCDRRWTTDGWRELFVKNAVMHCFAIGLIWGIYDESGLKTTFRYMDDGSFTTSDGDEFELPEGASIGLVHPLELTDEQKTEWVEQLDDFEIVQPFPQLSRRIFTIDDAEKKLTRIKRFDGCEINSLSLIGKMTKLGWYKGQAEDAGFFYYFYREDVTSRTVDRSGNMTVKGCGAMLMHSGTCIAAYDMEGETITAGDLVFFNAGNIPSYWSKNDKGFLRCSEVSPRYFSEMILQLTGVLGGKDAT